jgi:serine/threonine protein kinase
MMIGSALVAAAAAAPVVDWSDVFKDFIACCLTKDPELRWSATQLLQHPFVQATADIIRAKDGAVGSRELKGLVTRYPQHSIAFYAVLYFRHSNYCA